MNSPSNRHMNKLHPVTFRNEAHSEDRKSLHQILLSTGIFHPYELDVAMELLDDRLKKGAKSDYLFLFADAAGTPAGYACYGPITVTDRRFDLYWITVRKEMQGLGIGGLLLDRVEKHIAELGGTHVVVETSSRDVYKATREFYKKHDYIEAARIPRYYSDDDDKVVFMKALL